MSPPDGTTDFRSFSDAELDHARVSVDFTLNPLDHENVRIELRRRRDRRKRKLLPIMLRVAGGYFTLGGVLLVGKTFAGLKASNPFLKIVSSSPLATSVFAALAAMSALTLVAGVLLIRRKKAGLHLGLVAAAFQLLIVITPAFGYQFISVYAVVLHLGPNDLGLQLVTGPRATVQMGTGLQPYYGLDLVSLYIGMLLVRGLRALPRS